MPPFEIRLFTKRSNSLTLLEDKLFLVSYFWGVEGRAFFFYFPDSTHAVRIRGWFFDSFQAFLGQCPMSPQHQQVDSLCPSISGDSREKGPRSQPESSVGVAEAFLAASSKGRICVDQCIHFPLPASPSVNTPAHTIPTKVIISASIIPP